MVATAQRLIAPAATKKPRATLTASGVTLATGKVKVSVSSNAKKVNLTYRNSKNKKRTATITIRNGTGDKVLSKASKRIHAQALATAKLRRSPRVALRIVSPVVGDIDGDGSVQCSDQALMQQDWGSAAQRSDLNGDGVVGTLDLEMLLERWTADTYYCEVPHSRLEETVLRLVNEVRQSGTTCVNEPGGPYFAPVPVVGQHALVTLAASNHANYMAQNHMVGHEEVPAGIGFSGQWPTDRLASVGFTGSGLEDVAAGFTTPEGVVTGWLESEKGHCRAIMHPYARYAGLGFHYSPTAPHLGHYWALVLAL